MYKGRVEGDGDVESQETSHGDPSPWEATRPLNREDGRRSSEEQDQTLSRKDVEQREQRVYESNLLVRDEGQDGNHKA
jgi:hypothetical protein